MLKEFSLYLEFEGYGRGVSPCMFDPLLRWGDLCHLIHNEDSYKNIIKKHFGCSDKEAQFFIDFPLLNVVPGSKDWNGTGAVGHKVGTIEDITFISNKVIRASLFTVSENINKIKNLSMLYDIDIFLGEIQSLLSISEIEDKVIEYKKIHRRYECYIR